MREKVIQKILELINEFGEPCSSFFLSFDPPTNEVEVRALTDEQLIEILLLHGVYALW